MLSSLFEGNMSLVATVGILFAFFATVLLLWKCKDKLPRDIGRDFAVDGKLSAGKPRGAGFLFVLIFVAAALLFAPIEVEWIIYLLLVSASMLTGFLDDCAKHPWGEYKKAVLDLIIAIMVAVTYINYHGTTVTFLTTGTSLTLPVWLFGLLTVVLVWASINVTNCADGVDGLSATLTTITLLSFYILNAILGQESTFNYLLLLFMACLLGYLWHNATPSTMLMGDAGSRAMGTLIAIAALISGRPFVYLLFAVVLMVDGGIGLVKVALLRFLKIRILKNTRTPLHDHVRKVSGWSNTQAVFRFAIIQIVVSAAVIYMVVIK
ncbi:MAG: phospho-N-acetylmuramoyl-pentapeptide-transferase [Lachnospiraceae bacterium]|nr:phospho-N-acetylmuramoyl-pentapeptide-transferase [Lachnospiraceae bacterium]